jgi:hypothetical protein
MMPIPNKTIRIGCGAGFAGDRIDAAQALAERGALDFLFFECLAERTLAHSHLARAANSKAGYNPYLERRLDAVLAPCRRAGTRIVTNMGAANPAEAGEVAARKARAMGFPGLKIAVVEGDDVTSLLSPDMRLMESDQHLGSFGRPIVGANAYLGADQIADALDAGADIVITGRCADPSLVLGPLIHAHGWLRDDWARLGCGTMIGHLLECSAQVTGGCFADPGTKDVEDLAFIGYPFADVDEDGAGTVSKLPDTGGCVTRQTVLEQLFYEVHDPAAYLTPDVTADFSTTIIDDFGSDRVAVRGAGGRPRPTSYKVTIGFEGGFLSEAEIGYAGRNAATRARLAGEVINTRMRKLHGAEEVRIDLIGLNSLHGTAIGDSGEGRDVRLRAALRTTDRALADALVYEMETIWIAGPAGGAGMRGRVTPSVVTQSVLIERERIRPSIRMITS